MKKKFAGHYASLRARLVGRPGHRGWLFKAMIYVLLVSIGFVYLYPVLSMFVTSLMGLPDLLDAAVKWVPTAVTLDNYREALDVMRVKETLINSVVGALLPALAQAGAGPDCLKAVLTDHNRGWNALRLFEELDRERRALWGK